MPVQKPPAAKTTPARKRATKKPTTKPAKKAPAPRKRPAARFAAESVAAAVERELKTFPKSLQESVSAATARAMAREVDDPDNSATAKANCSRRVFEAMADLRLRLRAAQARGGGDRLDELRAGRANRRSAA